MRKSQFQIWMESVPGAQLLLTLGVAAAVVVLMVSSLVPPSRTTVATASGATTTEGGVALQPGDAVAGNGGEGLSAGIGGGGGTAGIGGRAGGAGGSGSGASSGPIKLTKSDRGVDENSVLIGFLTVDLHGLDATGYAPPLRKDINAVVDAYVDEANKNGGINGRKIRAEKRAVDPTSLDSQTQACIYMTRDAQVFGVVTTATNIRIESQKCYTHDNPTAYTHSYPMSQEFQAEAGFQGVAGGLDMSANRNLTRIAKEWAVAAKNDPLGSKPPDTGPFLKGGETVGVLTEECEPSYSQVIQKVFVPMLKSSPAVPKEVVLETTACDPGVQQTQASNAAQSFRSKNVTHVFLALNYISVQAFLQTADLFPTGAFKYSASDYNGVSADFFTRHWSMTQWDRVRGITVTYSGYKAAGNPITPEQKRCSDILVRHGLPGTEQGDPDSHAEVGGICDEFDIMVAAARAAGPNLTRAGWAYASQRLGRVPFQGIPSASYVAGKFSGGDTVADIEWHKECTCYYQISRYRPAQF